VAWRVIVDIAAFRRYVAALRAKLNLVHLLAP